MVADRAGETEFVGAGADTLVMSYTDYDKDQDVLLFVDPATGKAKHPAVTAEGSTLASNPFGDGTYDQQSIIVCLIAGIAPDWVSEYACIAANGDSDGPTAYPAAG